MRQLINKKKIYFYFFIFIFLTTAINTNYSKNFLKYLNVKSIDIIGLGFEDQIRLKENLDILKNKNIFLIKNDELLNILQKYNEFEDYKIQKIFPKKLKIEIRKTKYIAKTLIDGKEFLIGENKKFIEFKNYMLDQDLPVVFGNFPIESFINLQENLKKINFDLNVIDNYFYFKSGRWDLETQNNITIKLPLNNQLASLKNFNLLKKKKNLIGDSIIDFRITNKIIISNDK